VAGYLTAAKAARATRSAGCAASGVESGLIVHGLVTSTLNTEVLQFVLAPLFLCVDPSRGSIALQMLTLGVVLIVAALIISTLGTLSRAVPWVPSPDYSSVCEEIGSERQRFRRRSGLFAAVHA
jgi:threonine/homoserine/homoserine lactone efflux protein